MKCVDGGNVLSNLGDVCVTWQSPTLIDVVKPRRETQGLALLGVCVSYWEQVLCAPPCVLETLRNGYVLPFYTEPTPYIQPNQDSAQIEVE